MHYKNILVKIGERKEIIHHEAVIDPDTGEAITPGWDEEVTIPVMEAQNVPMTEEEEAQCAEEQRIVEAYEEERQREYAASEEGRRDAQVYYTAVMTDTLLEE